LNSGELLRQPGGTIQRGKRGQIGEEEKGFIGAGESDETGRHLQELKRGLKQRGLGYWRDQREEEEADSV
jgi:hypothetical protein